MIKYDEENLTLSLIKYSKEQTDVPNNDLMDSFEFAQEEYLCAQNTALKAYIVSCYVLWRTFAIHKSKGVTFNKFLAAQKKGMEESIENSDEQLDSIIKTTTILNPRTARDRMRVGYIIEQFIEAETKNLLHDKNYIPVNIMSHGMRQMDFNLIVKSKEPLKRLYERLIDSDAFGPDNRRRIEERKKKRWCDDKHKLESLEQKLLYIVMQDMLKVTHGGELIIIPKGAQFEITPLCEIAIPDRTGAIVVNR